MKKSVKRAFAVFMAAALSAGIMSGTAFAADAADDISLEEVYSMAQKALDQQAIQNVMSRHVMYHCYGEHKTEVEELWVQEEENRATASFGQNFGFYVGYDSIYEAYVESHDSTWLDNAKAYCAANGIDVSDMTDEEILDTYGGVGQLLLHVTTTAIIEVADDGQTAQAFWYSPGLVVEMGQTGNTIWEAYGVDFVKENGEWKIWHLHMFTDFTGSFYINLGGSIDGVSGGGGGNGSGSSDYLTSTQYKTYSTSRLRKEMELFLPLPYDHWNFDNDNYGPTRAQFEERGIDLTAWYEAHGGVPDDVAEVAPVKESKFTESSDGSNGGSGGGQAPDGEQAGDAGDSEGGQAPDGEQAGGEGGSEGGEAPAGEQASDAAPAAK